MEENKSTNEVSNEASQKKGKCPLECHSTMAIVGLLGAALILGICFVIGVKAFKNADRQVSVRGLCEKEVMADRAIYPIVFKEGGNNLVELASTLNTKNQIVLDFLKENGFVAAEISIAAPKVEDRNADNYNAANHGYDYVMTSVVTVCTDKVDKVLELQAKLNQLLDKGVPVGAGYSWDYPVTYSFEGLNKVKPDMIAEANQNARKAAEQFAKDSHSKLGKIKKAEQGLFTIDSRDQNTPQKKVVRVVTYVTYGLK
jgi:hypothetical protein